MARALSLNTATGFLHPVKEFHSQLFHLQNIALETYCAYSGWKFDTRFEEKKYFSSKQSFLHCHPLTRYSCLHSELQGVLPTWTVSNLNNEACASLKAEPGTGVPLGHIWPARTIPMGPYSLFEDSLSWKTLAAGWGDGPCAAHALQRAEVCAERARRESLAEVCPATGVMPLLAVYVLSQTDTTADQAGFLPPCPTFSGGKAFSKYLFS